MSKDAARAPENGGEEPAAGPGRDLDAWKELWAEDRPFPIQSRPGPLGALIGGVKRLLRPFFKAPVADLWDRQRIFNQILLDHLAERDRQIDGLLEHFNSEADWRVQEMRDQVVLVSRLLREGLQDVMRHNDALFARVDQKLDRYQRRTRDLERAFSEGELGAVEKKAERDS